MENILLLKSKKEKEKIAKWLTGEKMPVIDSMTIEELINSMSCCKSNLNEEILYCSDISEERFTSNFYKSLIISKKKKIDSLIKKYNESNSYNKVEFKNNIVEFSVPTYIESVNLDIEGFNYFYPMNTTMEITTSDGEVTEHKIIPFNYNGLYSEFIDLSKNDITFYPVGSKNNIYFFSCIYSDSGISVGGEVKFTNGKEYEFDNSKHIVFNSNESGEFGLLIKYQPADDFYEVKIGKKVVRVVLKFDNDFVDISSKYRKRLVMQ